MTDTDKSKAPRSSRGVDNPIIPSTQIREALLQILDEYGGHYKPREYVDEILNLFKAELNQLIEEVKAKKHNQQLPHNPTDEQRCRFYRDGGYNFALDLAKQVIVKRIEEMEGGEK